MFQNHVVLRQYVHYLKIQRVSCIRNLASRVKPPRNIILCGAPGSGKTTVAKMLGQKLGWKTLDVDDDFLEPFWGMPVAEKVKQLEPEGFQAILSAESDAFCQLDLPEDTGYVVSLSGSIPMCPNARSHMCKLGETIYIDVPPQDIIRRLGVMKVDRIFKHKPGASIQEVLNYRGQFYEQAHDYRAILPEAADKSTALDHVYECVKRMTQSEAFVSTRSNDFSAGDRLTFLDVILQSVAPDGGLYCPDYDIQPFSVDQLKRWEDLAWTDLILRVQERLIHPRSIKPQTLRQIIDVAYSSFADPRNPIDIFSLSDDTHISELFHGPTASFKDFPLQQLPHFYQLATDSNTNTQLNKLLVLVATSGDTGGATLDAFKRLQDRDQTSMRTVVLYPFGNVSKIQQQQMMSYHDPPSRHVCGVLGDFDDCQRFVKQAFRDQAAGENNLHSEFQLCAANSVNWGRIVGQIGMHFGTYFQLRKKKMISTGEQVDFSIPTGNFGNIYSAYLAKCMGLPINRLIMASNENNVLTNFVEDGILDVRRKLIPTSSPAIDILQPSNLERFLFNVSRNSRTTKILYDQLANSGEMRVSGQLHNLIQSHLKAGSCFQSVTFDTQRSVSEDFNYNIDPHTAVAYNVAQQIGRSSNQMVILSTAHPSKFTGGTDGRWPAPHSHLQNLSKVQLPINGVPLTSLAQVIS